MILIGLIVVTGLAACEFFKRPTTTNPVTSPSEDKESPVISVSGVSLTESNIVEVESKLILPTNELANTTTNKIRAPRIPPPIM